MESLCDTLFITILFLLLQHVTMDLPHRVGDL